ncbi:putative beta-lysine N-acetyltransferase [Brevibacillus ruminantium]|uniref:Beta-lysine N-acetyltransferase n=1 Tax=Brevibacillus ruminantium TaxID=2950604 RepID=A0ABY4WA85_9BACL|nr:putative beta-lysine N-acetyltransferase [Brevibacillus ruminantium]USG63834.1 putative beta-lysine N-acetyltransferase [Brevibacillus ruminantium]
MMDASKLIASGDLVIDHRNRRVKLHSYAVDEIVQLHAKMKELAEESEATKLIVYAKKQDIPAWQSLGYQIEGVIDGFFQGENAHLLACFLTSERASSTHPQTAEDILKLSLSKAGALEEKPLPEGYTLREGREEDAEELANLYRTVFPTYPTPMDDPEYVRKTMSDSTYYMVIEYQGSIACAASAEVTPRYGSAEMTDCATHPEHLGKGLLQPIFKALEEKMKEMGIFYLYTLTRAQSAGMNVTAAKHGYQYRGRLVNNCTIFSGYEDMNIWVKPLRPVRE